MTAEAEEFDMTGPTATVSKAVRGPNFMLAEDIELCKAFVNTSEDDVHGNEQRSADFKNKLMEQYNLRIEKCNRQHCTAFVKRLNPNSLNNRFKKISRFALKHIAIEEQMGRPPSGDTDREKFIALVKETFLKRHQSDAGNMIETIACCKILLGNHPKWRKCQQEEDARADEVTTKRKERPAGTKKAKDRKADRDLITAVVNGQNKDQKSQKGEFVERITGSIDVLSKGKWHDNYVDIADDWMRSWDTHETFCF